MASRRAELDMTQADVAAAGGPSDLTLRKIERGESERPDFHTLRKLEVALDWAAGSAHVAFYGGTPAVLEGAGGALSSADRLDHLSRPEAPITGIEHGVILRTDALAELTRNGLVLDDLPEEALSAEIVDRVAELRYALDRLTRAWIIRQAELARIHGDLSSLVLVLGDHLKRPVDENLSEADQEDLSYLRWLANYQDASRINAETAARYARRLAARRPE